MMKSVESCEGMPGYLEVLRTQARKHGRRAISHWSSAPDRLMGFKSPEGTWGVHVGEIRRAIPAHGNGQVADIFMQMMDGAMNEGQRLN